MLTSSIRFRVNLLGAVALLAHVSLALLSYLQTPALWRGHDAPQAVAFFDTLMAQFPVIGLSRMFETNSAVLVSYFFPLALATGAAVTLVMLLTRCEGWLDEALVRLLLRWSMAFAAACLISFPLFTQDFWLSAVWGRMVAGGMNPYHTLFTAEIVAGLPLDHFPMAMSYGPVWALMSGAVMLAAGQSVLATAVLFKLILTAAWVGVLMLVEKVTEPRPLLDRCLAIGLLGWMPLGVTQTVAEGHSDVVMALPALLWMFLVLRDRWAAPAALVVSILAKYTTAPLMVIDAVAARRMHRLSWNQIALRYLLPGLIALVIFGAFYRSPAFFDGTRIISQWHFLQPRDAIAAVQVTLGVSLFPAEYLIAAGCAGFAVYRVAVFSREPEPDNMAKAALAIMCAVSFAAIAHLWPWYVIWMLALATAVPRWRLSQFVVRLSILAPFTLIFWCVELFPHALEWAAAALYVGALMWTVLARAALARGRAWTA